MNLISFKSVLIVLIFIAGCSGNKPSSIRPDQFVIYGSDPLSHTIYLGSDDQYHYFKWQSGKAGGEWRVLKSNMQIDFETPKDKGGFFLHKDENGQIKRLAIDN